MRVAAVLLITAFLSGMALAQGGDALVAQADEIFQKLWTTEYTPDTHDALQAQLEQAISLYEQALSDKGEDPALLVKLSRCYYTLADVFAPQKEKKALYEKGQEYGERALRATPGFAEIEKSKGFVEAVKSCDCVEAAYWTYGNWARKVELGGLFGLLAAAARGDDKKLQALIERCLELDPDYLAGGPYRSLGAYWAKHPTHKDFDKAKELFERAMAGFPEYLENKLFYAQYYLIARKMWQEAAQALEEIIAAPLDDYQLDNSVTKLRAQELLAEVKKHL